MPQFGLVSAFLCSVGIFAVAASGRTYFKTQAKEMVMDTIEQQYVFDMIAGTRTSFFLTGKAGTGKTTFLKKVQAEIEKNFVVVAPTGVAALNAGGQTIHSFFGISLGVQTSDETGSVSSARAEVMMNVDSIIVDEVSMVRCDIIDTMDRTLRLVRKNDLPFGGVQMIFVGDLFQLPPVVKNIDKEILSQHYADGPYFFYMADALRSYNLPKIEFTKIYRQNEADFIALLDRVRLGTLSYGDLQLINSRVQPGYVPEEDGLRIILACYAKDASHINERRLAGLPGKETAYHAEYEGEYGRVTDAAEKVLTLKPAAQVMFTRNDSEGRWVNGTIGKVADLSEHCVRVSLGDGKVHEVTKVKWEAIDYVYNRESKRLEKNVIGSVMQYPLKLAWSVTIHKSQSLTFDKVTIDFGRGAFSEGQAYVALSRARTFEGLRLAAPLTLRSIKVSKDVLEFAKDYNDLDHIQEELIFGACSFSGRS